MEGGGRFKRVGHFTVDNLQAILRNKAYIGVKIYSVKGEQKETKAVWPAIIDEVTFQRVGKILDKNRRKYPDRKIGIDISVERLRFQQVTLIVDITQWVMQEVGDFHFSTC